LLLLLFKLHRAHPTDGLFPLDTLFFTSLKDLFILNTQFSTLNVKTVESRDDGISIYGLTEVGESQATESTLLVEMVVECIWCWDREGSLWKMTCYRLARWKR
jgi:hypothetical protein